jgi:hypothetical protein
MTLQTAWNYGTIEIRDAIAVPGAVHPPQFSPVGNRQLKELISFPEQVCLPFSSGPYYQAKPLSALCGVWRQPLYCGLEEAVFLLIHPEK